MTIFDERLPNIYEGRLMYSWKSSITSGKSILGNMFCNFFIYIAVIVTGPYWDSKVTFTVDYSLGACYSILSSSCTFWTPVRSSEIFLFFMT